MRSATSASARIPSSTRPFLLHARRILEEVARGVTTEPLPRANAAQREVHVRTTRRAAQDLVAEGDGVVEQAHVGIVLDGALIVRDGVRNAALSQGEVTHLVQQRDVDVSAFPFAFLNPLM
jgi:hypothetical protein